MMYLEEDLAVTLMIKLLWVPMFHDLSFIGRILSFFFRLFRIFLGFFAMALATVTLVIAAIFWFISPILLFLKDLNILGIMLVIAALGFFLIHILTHPHKKVWEIKDPTDLWKASWLKPKDLSPEKLLKTPEVQNILKYLEIDQSSVLSKLVTDQQKTDQPTTENRQPKTDNSIVYQQAFSLAKKSGSTYIGPRHFFVAMIKNTFGIDEILLKNNLEMSDFELVLTYMEKKRLKWRLVYLWNDDFAIHHLKGVNRGWLGSPTPNLDLFSNDLTRMAGKVGYPDFIGRETTVSEIINILSQENARNVILVAPPGSGKSALVNFLAKRIVSGDAPATLAIKRIVSLDLTKLMSGIESQGQLAERVKSIFEDITYTQNVILVVEEIHNLGIGEAGAMFNLYSLMLPYIESFNIQFIGTTEPENYTRIIEKQGAFARLFTKVVLPPATDIETMQILEDKSIDIEKNRKIRVSYLAIKKAVELSSKYIKDKVLPDSALSILQQAETNPINGWVTTKSVEGVVESLTNIPVEETTSEQKTKLLNLEEEIHRRLIDQEEAVKAVSDTLRRASTGLREEKRPIGSFLFVGPTGVGKTELAKILADIYFAGHETVTLNEVKGISPELDPSARPQDDREGGVFTRFDMSEYQTPESVNRLIGGTGEPGELTEAVRNKPYCLLLLDEFEKADPKILTLFLQVLEDGRLTDGEGKTIDFTSTIIIATSNVGSLTIVNGLQSGKSLQELEQPISQELLQTFKPELINRFDKVVLFKPLSQEHLQLIVTLKLRELQTQMKQKGYLVEFDDSLIKELAQKGFDPVLGARPMRRLVQDTLESNLSKLILENKLEKGKAFKIGIELLNSEN